MPSAHVAAWRSASRATKPWYTARELSGALAHGTRCTSACHNLCIVLDQIRREISDPYYQQNFPNDGQRFIAWYLRRVMLRDRITTRDDITDGANDKQMDAVIVDDDERRIIIVQGKFIGENSVDGEPLREVLGAWARLQDLQTLQQDCNDKLKQKLEAVRAGLEDEYRVDFELLTTGALTEAAKADMKAFADRLEESDDFSAGLHLVDSEVLEFRLAEAEAMELPSLDHSIVVDPAQTLVTKIGERQIIVTMLPLRVPAITRNYGWKVVPQEREAVFR